MYLNQIHLLLQSSIIATRTNTPLMFFVSWSILTTILMKSLISCFSENIMLGSEELLPPNFNWFSRFGGERKEIDNLTSWRLITLRKRTKYIFTLFSILVFLLMYLRKNVCLISFTILLIYWNCCFMTLHFITTHINYVFFSLVFV